MELKMICIIDYYKGNFFASMWINDINGNEYMEPFVKKCSSRSEAVYELRNLMTGKSRHYDCQKLEFKRVNYHKLGKDEIFEYKGYSKEG